MASANILARHGLQQPCEDMLAATRGLYKAYLSGMRKDGGRVGWTCPNGASDRLLRLFPLRDRPSPSAPTSCSDAEVRSPDGVALGSVDDLALIPRRESSAIW